MQKLIRGWNHRLQNYTDVITNRLTATTYPIFKGPTCSWSDGGWITTTWVCNLVVSMNPADGEVYSIPRHVIKFVSDMRQVGVFSLILETILSMWPCRHIMTFNTPLPPKKKQKQKQKKKQWRQFWWSRHTWSLGLTAILVIMSVSIVKLDVILYI